MLDDGVERGGGGVCLADDAHVRHPGDEVGVDLGDAEVVVDDEDADHWPTGGLRRHGVGQPGGEDGPAVAVLGVVDLDPAAAALDELAHERETDAVAGAVLRAVAGLEDALAL